MTADLVRQAQRGDHAAFETLIAAAYDRLFAIAYRILRKAGAKAATLTTSSLQVSTPITAPTAPVAPIAPTTRATEGGL